MPHRVNCASSSVDRTETGTLFDYATTFPDDVVIT
jgi:hypothetical protein